MRTIRNGVVEDIPLREGEATVDVKAGLEMMLGFLFGDLERMKRRVAELEEELAKYRNDDWTGRVTYDNVVDLIASNEDAAVRDQTRKVFEPLLKKETARKLQRDVKRKVKEMEEADGVGAVATQVVNHFEAGSTAQVFNGPTTGVFKE
ncbi:MAG: hypothetical protein IJK45_09760 [Bacteroidaceae bacterium]|nr:hypothetical protein [Bacteroidaceae bacterium]